MTTAISKKGRRSLAALIIAAMMLTMFPMQAHAASYTADTTFTFSNSAITASGGSSDNYEIDGTDLKITAAGTYVVTGSCSEGSVTVKKGTTGVVLVVKDLTLSSSGTAPISLNKTTEVQMVVEGTNTVTDKEDPANEDSADEAVADAFEGAAIKVKSGASLTISGTGTLTADGSSCKNGIKGASTASITVESGTLNISAAKNGLASDGSLTIAGGTVNVTSAGNDGIKADPDEDDTDSAGTLTITGGTVKIKASEDGLQATGDLTITGGSVTIDAGDDAIHSDANVSITGGTVTIDAGDDAIHADYVLTLGTKGAASGPKITVNSSYEGFEGAQIYMNAGSGTLRASDDGVNAANKNLSNYAFVIDIEGGTWYVDSDGDGLDSNKDIIVNGGSTLVFGSVNNGDGALDYDGTCTVNDGELLCVGMSGMAMSPSTGTYVMFGGNGMGMGGFGGGMRGGMGQRPDNMGGSTTDGSGMDRQRSQFPGERPEMPESWNGQTDQNAQNMPNNGMDTQSSISISKGDTIVIRDASGNTLISATATKAANSVMYSSAGLTSGSEYTLLVGGSEVATATAATGNGMSGGMPGQMPGQGGQPSDNGQTPAAPTQPSTGGESIQNTGTGGTSGGTTTAQTVAGFTDVKTTDWFAKAVEYVHNKQYMVGTSATTFAPNTNLTRAMMVQILYNIEGKPAVDGQASYTDVADSDWFADAVTWAEDNELIQGYGNGRFGAADALTREQAATILNRYAEYKGLSIPISGDLTVFTDADTVSDWAKDAMEWAVGLKVINGTAASTLDPAGTATRAQMAQILMNLN